MIQKQQIRNKTFLFILSKNVKFKLRLHVTLDLAMLQVRVLHPQALCQGASLDASPAPSDVVSWDTTVVVLANGSG